MSKRSKAKKAQADRAREAEANRRKYGSWRDVIEEAQWLQCGKCHHRQCVKGSPLKRKCKRCGETLSLAQ